MIKTRLIEQVPSSKKYIALTVLAQWLKTVANIVMISFFQIYLRKFSTVKRLILKDFCLIWAQLRRLCLCAIFADTQVLRLRFSLQAK